MELAGINDYKQPSYCAKCMQLSETIYMWELGVGGVASNFSRIRKVLLSAKANLQTLLDKFSGSCGNIGDGSGKDCSNAGVLFKEAERSLLLLTLSAVEEAMDIGHNSASACFRNAQKDPAEFCRLTDRVDISGADIRSTRSLTFTSTGNIPVKKPATTRTKRPFSIKPVSHADLPGFGESAEDAESELTLSENHFAPAKTSIIPQANNYTQWTILDPIELKPPKLLVPFRSHLASVGVIRQERKNVLSGINPDTTHKAPPHQPDTCNAHSASVSPSLSNHSISSDSDVQLDRVMSKLSLLEEERLHLMQTIETLKIENLGVRQSLREAFASQGMKDVQLKLAMQDLGIATVEIKKASELHEKLRSLEKERLVYADQLAGLEDESSAVKLSLIQLLQEKSATNRHLAMENTRLHRQLTVMPTSGADVAAAEEPRPNPGEDLIDGEVAVHKQGFLIKRGGRVRTWKKRLFVLDDYGLSYYRTDQPISTIPFNQIISVNISRETLPSVQHLFEIHTSLRRTYLCAASSHENMQSWVGLLQTLTQYYRTHGSAVCRTQSNNCTQQEQQQQDVVSDDTSDTD